MIAIVEVNYSSMITNAVGLWSDRDRDLTFATKRSQITAHFKSDLDLDQITKM